LKQTVSTCQLCELAQNRRQTVFGSGNQTASLMIVGDAPTTEDEKQGDVFCGQAGKLLTAMLKAMGYQRNDVYVSNIVKCKISENQEPSEQQAIACEPYLLRQISLLKPKLILALGNAAAQRLLKTKSTMNRLRGQLHYVEGLNVPVLVSYHPTYLLAAPNEKRKAWEDLQLAMKELKQ
jgi:uracil-DNA glycosylase family 4